MADQRRPSECHEVNRRENHDTDTKTTTESHAEKEKDLFRDTPVRYLGYANEVGESFRSLVHVNVVRASYLVASAYVCADAYDKGSKASKIKWSSEATRKCKTRNAVLDTLLWQGLASVAIPGFTINRICFVGMHILRRTLPKLPPVTRGWMVTALGLGAIPFIIKPIDRSVDWMLEKSVRKWYCIDELEETVVHHTRDA